MSETCLNCNNPVIENVCSNCGQKKYKRIDKNIFGTKLNILFFIPIKGYLPLWRRSSVG
jgi:hypothetical protein